MGRLERPFFLVMGEPEITTLADGSLRVCLRHHAGVEACCYVSSMHLVEDHLQQLRNAIYRQLEKAEV